MKSGRRVYGLVEGFKGIDDKSFIASFDFVDAQFFFLRGCSSLPARHG